MKNRKSLAFTIFTLSAFLSGCASTGGNHANAQWHFLPMAVPLQPTVQQEVKLAKIDQLLSREGLTENDLAQIFFERGLVNDSLGMRDLARLDFNRSLAVDPAQPEVFNVLGIYFTQNAMYDEAYEAFDSSLELDENNAFAQRNRGIALYYGGRYSLAEKDLLDHYAQNESDVYRSIWLYLVEQELYSPAVARDNLEKRYLVSNQKDWAWLIVRYYIGELDEKQLLTMITQSSQSNDVLAARLCEAYFYLAKAFQKNGDLQTAIAFYKLAMSANMYEFIEHRYSMLELSRIVEQQRAAMPTS